MRISVIALLLAALACGKTEQTSEDDKGVAYGDELTATETLAIADVLARGEELEGKRVRVEGLVTDVCATRGCWFQMAGEGEGEQITFKVVDGVMVFPMSMKGKYAVAEGTVQILRPDLEASRKMMAHRAKDSGKEFDPESITEPLTIVRLAGIGAVARDSQ